MYKVKIFNSDNSIDQNKSKIGTVRMLVYCEDVSEIHSLEIMSSEETYSEDQEDLDDLYLSYSDDELKHLSEEEIQKVQNMSLIQRIGQLGMYKKLSVEQRSAYKVYAENYHWLEKGDIPEVLQQIKNCNRLQELYPRNKNADFATIYDLYLDDLLEIVHSIEPSDFNETTSQLSYHHRFYGDQVLIFDIDGLKLSSGKVLTNIKIYIKIDYSQSRDSSIAYFSIHKSKTPVEDTGDKE